jgi:acyl-CoA thioester hydrolase
MDLSQIGRPTFHTRVESWQCDFNHHWNARYYARSFQMAAETAQLRDGEGLGAAAIVERRIRFHRELFVGASVEVRSALLAGGLYDGRILHLLTSEGRLSAIALDSPGSGGEQLPVIASDSVSRLLPRDHAVLPDRIWDMADGEVSIVELGRVRPSEVDHTDDLLFEEIIARTAVSSHDLLLRLGYTMKFTEQSGIGRMAAEINVRRIDNCPAGTVLTAATRIAQILGRSFALEHLVLTSSGALVAAIRQTMLAVDMKTRRTVEVPDFLRRLRE